MIRKIGVQRIVEEYSILTDPIVQTLVFTLLTTLNFISSATHMIHIPSVAQTPESHKTL